MPTDADAIARLQREVAVLREELGKLKAFVADYVHAQTAVREQVSNELRDLIDRPSDLHRPGA